MGFKKHFATYLFCLLFASFLCAQDEHDLWEVDFDQALKLAGDSGKDIIVDFSGSDWCGWCMKLDKEVFTQKAFMDEAPDKYILVVLDFPRKKKVENAKRNAELRDEFGVQGFPTVLLMDPAGKPYARTGYRPGGAEPYLEHMVQLRTLSAELGELVRKLEAARGPEKIKAINEIFSFFDGLEGYSFDNLAIGHPELPGLLEAAFELDPDNKAGLKEKVALFLLEADLMSDKVKDALKYLDPDNKKGLQEKLLQQELMKLMQLEDFNAVVKTVDDFLRDKSISDPNLDAWVRYMAGYAAYKGLGDKEKGRAFFQQSLELKPSNGRMVEAIKKFLDEMDD